MSIEVTPSFLTLPVELLYRILDELNTKDILFSFRYVCALSYEITNSYNRYQICLTSPTSKAEIRRILRIIIPENVISLTLINTLSEKEEKGAFTTHSLLNISQFTRLRSVSMFQIHNDDLQKILQHLITVSTLRILSLKFLWISDISDMTDLFSSIITMPGLRKLCLSTTLFNFHKIPLLNQCKIEHLTIDTCNHTQFCHIIHHLPNLRTFSSCNYTMDESNQFVLSTSFQQLTSLTLRSSFMIIHQLESLLSCTPSLVHLHIASYYSSLQFLHHFSQWEKFIQQKLPLLNTLKFHIQIQDYRYQDVENIETILKEFSTSFWLEQKRWYVTCKYINDEARSDLMFYTSNHTNIQFPDNLLPSLLSYTTSTKRIDDRINTWSARFNLDEMDDAIYSRQLNRPTQRIFHNMTQLALDINWPINSFNLLRTLTDLSQLIEIWLFSSDQNYLNSNTMKTLLDSAYNVQTLGIAYSDEPTSIPSDICSILSRKIKHLKLHTTCVEYAKLALEQIEGLSSVTFIHYQCSTYSWTHFIEWLTESGKTFSLSDDHRCLHVCLDNESS